MRKITMTVAAFLATAAISAADITSAGVTITVQGGKSSASTEFSLPKGSYVIDGGTNKELTVTVSLDGGNTTTALTDGKFTLEKETTCTVKATYLVGNVEAISSYARETTVKVTPDATELKNLQDKYTKQLSSLYVKASSYTTDKTLQTLAGNASTLISEISKYGIDEYIEYQETGKLADLEASINDMSTAIDNAVVNYVAYQNALSAGIELQSTLAELKKVCDNKIEEIQKADEKADVSSYTATYNNAKKTVDDFVARANTAYSNQTAASEFSDDNIETMTTEIKSALTTAKEKIEGGSTNDLSYANVKIKVANARSTYNTIAESMYSYLLDKGEGNLYSDIYTDSLTKLRNKCLGVVEAVEKANQSDYDAGKATTDTQTKYSVQIEEAEKAMNAVWTNTKATVDYQRSCYAAATKDIADNVQGYFKDKVTSKTDNKTNADAKTYFQSQMDAIQKKIDDLTASVDATNEKHALKEETGYGVADYAKNKAAILADIDKLYPKVDNAVAEIAANNSAISAIKAVNKTYTDEKAKADDAKNATYNYKGFLAKGKFTATETSISNAISKLTTDREAAYSKSKAAFDKSLKDAVTFNNELTEKISGVNKSIDAYKKAMSSAMSSYKKIYDEYTAFKTAVDKLKEASKENTEVTIDGSSDGTTYAAQIQEYETSYDAIVNSLDTAYTKYSDVKVNGLTIVTVLEKLLESSEYNAVANKTTEINGYANNYASNKSRWENSAVEATFESTLKRADDLVKELGKALVTYDKETYGKKCEELNKEKDGYNTTLSGYETSIETKRSATASAETISELLEINSKLESLKTDVAKLSTKAENAKTEYAAETSALNALDLEIVELTHKVGGGKKTVSVNGVTTVIYDYPGIENTLNGNNTSHRRSFNDEISNVYTLLSNLSFDIDSSYVAETLRKDKQDSKGDNNQTVLGYDSRKSSINTVIEKLIELAKNENANDKNQIAFDLEKTNAGVSALISTAKADVEKVATGDGKTYFDNVISGYETEYKDIETNQEKYYKENVTTVKVEGITYSGMTDTSKNMTFNHTGLTTKLNTLVSNIKAVAGKAKANNEAYTTLTANLKKVNDTWKTVFQTVSGAATSSAHQAAINALNDEKTKLNNFEKTLKSDFGRGLASDNQTSLQSALNDINTTIGELSTNWKSDYDKAVTADNATRYNSFNTAYTALNKTYKEYVDVVTAMSKTSFASKVTDDLVALTGENGIFSYAEKISALKTKADTEFNATVTSAESDLYDANEVNKDTADVYKAKIIEMSEKYCEAVNTQAHSEYANDLVAAQILYSAALNDIKTTTNATDDEAKAALKDVGDIISGASALKGKDGKFVDNMALQYENTYKAKLSTVEGLIPADKLAAANTVWNARITEASQRAVSESKEIAGFKSTKNADYATQYATLAKNINDASTAWDKIAAADKYTKFGDAYTTLNNFINTYSTRVINKVNVTHTAIYWSAYDDNEAYKTDDIWYNKMLDEVSGLQAVLDEEQAFAEDMIVARELDVLVADYQDDVDGFTSSAEDYHKNYTSSEANYNTLLASIKTKKAEIQATASKGIKYETIKAENARFNVVLGQLNLDYVNATAAEGMDAATIATYKKTLEGYSEENTKIYKAFTDGLKATKDADKLAAMNTAKAAYLALEKKIGTTKSELTALFDKNANATAQTALQTAINNVKTTQESLVKQLADCHAPVVEAFKSDVDAMGETIKPVQAKLDESVADATVLLYEDVISASIKKVADTYAGLDTKIKNMEDPYDVNDTKYIELSGVITELSNSLKAVYDKTADFILEEKDYGKYSVSNKWVSNWQTVRDHDNETIADKIAKEKESIDGLNATGTGLTAKSTVNKSVIMKLIVAYERDLSYYNAEQLTSEYSTSKEKALIYQLIEVKEKIASNVYTENYTKTLDYKVDSISKEIDAVSEWNTKFGKRDNTVTDDFLTYYLNGDENDAKKGSSYENYAKYYEGTTPYLAIMDNVAKIESAIAALDKDADKIVGDADGDGVVGVNDYTYIVNVIMESDLVDIPEEGTEAFKLADANCDGKIDVADAVAVVNAILGKNTTSSAAVRRASSYDAGSSMSLVGEGSGYSQRIAVNLSSSVAFVGGQIDVVLPEGMTANGASLGERASSLELRSATLKSGVTRLLITSVENNEIGGSEGAVAYIDVNVTPSYKGQAIELSSAVFADANGRRYSIGLDGEATGISSVTTTEYIKGKVYSVGGQVFDGLKKGVNIIRNTDGTSKKVLVK